MTPIEVKSNLISYNT